MLSHRLDHRRMGSSALSLCHVADGRLDGLLCLNCNSWDVLAGLILVEEAGGLATVYRKGHTLLDRRAIAATTPGLADAVTAISNIPLGVAAKALPDVDRHRAAGCRSAARAASTSEVTQWAASNQVRRAWAIQRVTSSRRRRAACQPAGPVLLGQPGMELGRLPHGQIGHPADARDSPASGRTSSRCR